MTNSSKNKKISETGKATRQRRKTQICKTFELKIDKSHLSKITLEHLNRIFLEAKWFYNYCLANGNSFKGDYKIKKVSIKTGQINIGNEEEEDSILGVFNNRELIVLKSQVRQTIINQLKQNIINLHKSKLNGNRIGRLRFKTKINTILLNQYNNGITSTSGTHKIKGNRIKIIGISQWMLIRGIEQLKEYEISVAKIIHKAGDFYFHVTCFIDKDKYTKMMSDKAEKQNKPIFNKPISIGIDFGILNQMTLSNEIQLAYQIPITKQLKRLDKLLCRKRRYSKNYYKTLIKLQKQYQYLNNQKHDIKKKILHILNTEFKHICYQNDCMQGWQILWGKRMLNTAIGGIIADLRKSATAIEVSRVFPSTKQCRICKHKQKVSLSERTFICENCKHKEERDVHSARSIQAEALKNIGVEYTELTPEESDSSILRLVERFNAIPHVEVRLLKESGSPKSIG